MSDLAATPASSGWPEIPVFREIASLQPPSRRGRPFEELVRWFLLSAPRYRGVFSDVWLWRDWPEPERWKEDEAGIDLVARTVGGERWAIQAKAWDPLKNLPYREMSKFLAESARPVFANRLLVATSFGLSRQGWDAVYGADKDVSVLLLHDLVSSEVQWPETLGELRPAPLLPRDPLPHQVEVIKAVVEGFAGDEVDAGQLVMACGSGKTLAALWIGERLQAERVLVLMPSLALVRQTLDAWKRSEGTPRPFLTVCSDQTVSGDDGFTEHARDLGVRTTTEPDEIAAFLAGKSPRVVYATYQSSPQIAEAFARTPGLAPFDFVVADEAHQLTGRGGGGFATVLDRTKIPARRRLFMTATPKKYSASARKAAADGGLTIESMDDTSVFGRVVHRLGLREAIDREILADYRVAVIVVDSDEINDMVAQRRFVRPEGTGVDSAADTDAEQLVGEIGLLMAMDEYDLRRMISFHSRKLRASRYADSLPQTAEWLPASKRPTGRITCRHVNGTMTVQKRQRLMTPLDHPQGDERVLVTNARCLSEGVDVPELDAVAFVDPRRSTIDIVQAVGRAIRRKHDRTRVGTILVPLAIPANTDPDEALAVSNFDRIRDVLLALRGHDELLADELDELRRSLGRNPTKHIDLPDRIRISTVFERAFVDAISVRLVELGTDSWEFMFGLLLRHKDMEGSVNVHPRLVFEGKNLGTWAVHQRVLFKNGTLDPRRERLLREAGLEFELRRERFNADCDAIATHIATYGHLPRTSGSTKNERRLAGNIALWRKKRESETLPDWQFQRLHEMDGFYWSAFEESLAPITAFIKNNGRRPTDRTGANETEKRLAARLRAIEKRALPDTEAQILATALENAPVWETRDARWNRRADEMEEFLTTTSRLPRTGAPDRREAELAVWQNSQRQRHRSNLLSDDRVARLNSIHPHILAPPDADARFNEDADLVEMHVRQHGALPNRSSADPEEARLARWCSSRKMEARGTGGRSLSPGRLERLKQIPDLLD